MSSLDWVLLTGAAVMVVSGMVFDACQSPSEAAACMVLGAAVALNTIVLRVVHYTFRDAHKRARPDEES